MIAMLPYVLGIVAALATFATLKHTWKEDGRREATAAIVQASKKEGAKANAVAKKVRDAAAAPGAAERLRKAGDCRDC